MITNRLDIRLTRGEPFTQILTYQECGMPALVDFTQYELEAKLLVPQSIELVTLHAVGVGLGKIKLHATEEQINQMAFTTATLELHATASKQSAPKLVFCGHATILA